MVLCLSNATGCTVLLPAISISLRQDPSRLWELHRHGDAYRLDKRKLIRNWKVIISRTVQIIMINNFKN